MRFIAIAAILMLIPAATPAAASCMGASLTVSQAAAVDMSAAKKKAKKAKKAKVEYMKAAPSK